MHLLVVFLIVTHPCVVANHLKLQSNTFSYWTGNGDSVPGLKQSRSESDHFSPPSVDFQNAWSYIPTSPFDFMACVGTRFTSIITWRSNFLFEKLDFQNAWSYIPTSPFDFMACVGTRFTSIITWRSNFLFEKLCVTHSDNKLFILHRPECKHCLHYNPTVNTVALLTLTVYSFKTYQL